MLVIIVQVCIHIVIRHRIASVALPQCVLCLCRRRSDDGCEDKGKSENNKQFRHGRRAIGRIHSCCGGLARQSGFSGGEDMYNTVNFLSNALHCV